MIFTFSPLRKIILTNIVVHISFLLCFCRVYATEVSGTVYDRNNNQPIEYVNVVIRDTDQATFTDSEGFFRIEQIQPGKNTLQISRISYAPVDIEINIVDDKQDIYLPIYLIPVAIEMDEIIVTDAVSPREISISHIEINRRELVNTITIAEPDVFLYTHQMPGVGAISDFSSGMFVRGGSLEQNLILLDDIEIFNPTHFGSLFSAFNSDAIDRVHFYKGGFPAQYDSRLSSILDIKNRRGNRDQNHGTARLSLLNLSTTTDGPWQIGTQNGAYLVSFRRSYLELLQKGINDIPDYDFYDAQAKIDWSVGPKDILMLTAYAGEDNLSIIDHKQIDLNVQANWNNNAVSAQWTHLFDNYFSSHIVVGNSRFRFSLMEEFGENKYSNGIDDLTFKGQFTLNPQNNHLVEFGIETKHNIFSFDNINQDVEPEHNPSFHFSTLTSGLYLQDTWKISPFWTLQSGLRLSNFLTLDQNLEQSARANYTRLSPSISIQRTLSKDTNIFFNYGRYYQFLNIISNDINSPYNIWIPIDGSLKPSFADHYIAGYRSTFYPGLVFDIEVYYKNMNNLVEYNTETNKNFNANDTTLNEVFHIGKGYALGTDFLLRTDFLGWEGLLGYAFCISRRKLDGLNINPDTDEPEYFYPKHDRTHQINIIQAYNLTERLDWHIKNSELIFGFSYHCATGQPARIPEKIYFGGDHINIFYSYHDRVRLPAYSRLDLSLKMRIYKPNLILEPFMQAINVTNRKNIYHMSYFVDIDESHGLNISSKDYYQFPFMPFLGINVLW